MEVPALRAQLQALCVSAECLGDVPRPLFVRAAGYQTREYEAVSALASCLEHMRSALMYRNVSHCGCSLAFSNGDPPSVVPLVNVARLKRAQFVQPCASDQREPHKVQQRG